MNLKKHKVGIALGGGGSRGFAHLGVLKALEEHGIVPDAIAGSSAGAIVGALLASGMTADQILESMKENTLTDFAKLGLPRSGFMTLDYLREELNSLLSQASFADLQHRLFVPVSNLLSGEVEYLCEGSVAEAVQASASIPVVFTPVEIDGQVYVDGGLLDNVPVTPLLGCCEKVVAVDIMPLERLESVEGMREVAIRTFQIAVGSARREQLKASTLLIELDQMAGYHILDTSKTDEMYEIGYKHVQGMDLSGF